MNFRDLQETLRNCVREFSESEFGITLDQIAAEIPPKTEMGDLAFPIAFELAKQIKKSTGEKQNPRALAEKIKTTIEAIDFVERVEVAGAGYLNVFFDRAEFLVGTRSGSDVVKPDMRQAKICVEHTSVNPNKAAHIGHVRNSVLGDTFVRMLRAAGSRVEVQNYIDNTGVQVADVVVGFLYLEKMNLEDIVRLNAELQKQNKSFDYFCWDLYAKVGLAYQSEPPALAGGQTDGDKIPMIERRAEVLHLIEEGNNLTSDLADYVASENVRCILTTMERLTIRYDLLPRESEILHLHFWDKAFEHMKELGVIHFETEGKNAGCWVMPFESHSGTEEHEADKILVRSNGTVTYTGKDIAYQMWKLGILGLDFHYRIFYVHDDGHKVWTTTSKTDEDRAPQFGGGDIVYNVIDSRQSYPQEIVREGVAAIDPEKGEKASVHLSYEMVALSPAAAEELGFRLSTEDKAKSFIEMSGRKGLGVKADDLIDRLDENALAEVEVRHPDLPMDQKKYIAHQIAVGALRYFLLKFTRNTVIVFDFKEALSFDGETGCFCQYSAVRANSIFKKLPDDSIENASAILRENKQKVAQLLEDDVWALITLASRLEETLHQAISQHEPAGIAKYVFNLAKTFNLFYHNHRIISEENEIKRAILITAADLSRRSLTSALSIMGIDVPEKM